MLLPHLDQPLRFREGKRSYQHKIRQGEDGDIRPDADRNQQYRGQGEARRPQQGPGGVVEIPPGDFSMHHGCIEDDLDQGKEPKPAFRRQRFAAAQFQGKDGAHLAAIFRPEAGGVKVEQRSIEVHQVVLVAVAGATPHKRAILSKSRRRPASASATAFPRGVMR